MYETIEIYEKEGFLKFKDILKNCICNYYRINKNKINDLQFDNNHHIISSTNNKLHIRKGE